MEKLTNLPPKCGKKPKNVNFERLPNRVRYYRMRAGLSLRQLAAAMNLPDYSRIHKYEMTGKGMSETWVYVMASVLNVKVRELNTPGTRYTLNQERMAERLKAVLEKQKEEIKESFD